MPDTRGESLRRRERCDSETDYLINFLSPDNVPEPVCWECVEREDKRGVRFSPSWTRQRRAVSRV
ncbi:MAG TPA: hypothetical protein VN228_18835 [Pyrinomonadaceae bacterium]|nr:hypothetical protein [Pyrinomonadaceae bacterium]